MPQSKFLNGKLDVTEAGKFYRGYLEYSSGTPLFESFESNHKKLLDIISGLDDEKAMFRYAPGKWSLKQMFGHMIDMEQIFSYRALSIARGEKTELPGYDHNSYVEQANFEEWPISEFPKRFKAIRKFTTLMFESFSDEMLMRNGVASGAPFTVRSLGFIIAGHELHHLSIYYERYLPGL